jgi:glycosyltransferase involved in cell wall biosynthesis
LRILHLDTGREWRGGQRQALFLHNGLTELGHKSLMVCQKDGELEERADNYLTLRFKSEADPVYIYKLLKIIKNFRPDIVHSHDSHSLTPAIAAATLESSFRLVHTRRVDFPLKKRLFNKYRSRRVKLVAISKAVRRIMAESGIPEEKIALIYSGSPAPTVLNETMISAMREKFNPEGRLIIGTVANFADHKDYPTLLRAFELLHEKHPEALLLLVGNGPLFEEIFRMSRGLECAESIVFAGFCVNIPEILSVMDIFTMTSKTEGLCTSIIDAMNAGLPVVATSAGGIPELVEEGETGFLCDVGDAESLADKYGKLLSYDSMREAMGKNGRKRAKLFSDSHMVKSYEKLYIELVK